LYIYIYNFFIIEKFLKERKLLDSFIFKISTYIIRHI